MNLALNRLAPLLALCGLLQPPARAANPPVFLTGSSQSDPYPYYASFNSVPVGKTLVVPIAVSGSGPLTYTVTSTSPVLAPIVKTGYPVMKIHVTYSGTTGTLATLYSFTGGDDGGNPIAGLLTGIDSLLYGTTETGGSSGFGTAYQITTSGSFSTLHTFATGTDGANPYAGLITGTVGNLYGTAETGGTGGFGTVYQLNTSGTFTTLYSFPGASDGANPYGGVVTGTDGLLYGTTSNGGAHSLGTVYSVSTSGSFNPLYSFTGGSDGSHPQSTLIQAANGNFYGTAVTGGSSSAGTIFEVTSGGALTPIHSFNPGVDGASPYAGLITGTDGNFYGTTETGGTGGYGTVYRLSTSGSVTTLHAFTDGTDGGNPYAGLLQGSDGNFYGTTETGGTGGAGTIYQLASSGSFATLYSFTGGSDGGNPRAALTESTPGVLFGTTTTSGTGGHGTVFEIPFPNTGAFSGTMAFALLRDMAPVTTGYIAGFAQAGYYNGLDFFRITNLLASQGGSGFIAQAGDPTNTGTGNPGFTFDNEFSPSLIFTGQGQLAMANAGYNPNTYRGTNGSQFFITESPTRTLDFGYTIFGQLLTGFDVMQKVMAVPLKSTSDGSNPTSPVTPVVMDSVTVSEDNTDAILLVSGAGYLPNGATLTVNATDPGNNKAVSLSGTVQTPGLSFSMVSQNDTFNDPPFLIPDPNVNLGLHLGVTLPIRPVDLEYDYLISGAGDLSFFSATSVSQTGVVTPNVTSPIGSVNVGLYTYQPFISGSNESAVTVGLGLGNLTPLPALLSGTPGGPVLSATATVTGSAYGGFLAQNPLNVAADFTASINWGDGHLTTGSNSVTVARSPDYPTGYSILAPAGHSYTNPGIYPVNVTVSDSNGGLLEVQNTAVVSPGPIYPGGRTFTASKGLASGLVATFVDHSPNVVASDYTASINWGDGSVGSGIIRGFGSNYQIYGVHRYAAGTLYPVDFTVTDQQNGATAYGWSVAQLTGVPTRQPPYSQSHITGEIGNPGFNGDFLSEEVTLVNSGNLPSGPIALKFFLSPNANTDPIDASAIQLRVGKGGTYNTPSILAGSALEGSVSPITLPANAVTRGKFIIMQVITSDPIAIHMAYPHAFADPYPLIE